MIRKTITALLITCLLCSSVFAGNFNVKLEKIYVSNDKMLVSWEEGKKSALLVPVKEEGKPTLNISTHFKAGVMYPVYYPDSNDIINIVIYDDNGNTQKFIDDTASRLKAEAQVKNEAAQKEADLRAQAEVPWVILGITFAIILAVVIIKAVESTDTTSTTSK